jgi:hypothetical protein
MSDQSSNESLEAAFRLVLNIAAAIKRDVEKIQADQPAAPDAENRPNTPRVELSRKRRRYRIHRAIYITRGLSKFFKPVRISHYPRRPKWSHRVIYCGRPYLPCHWWEG